MGWRRGRRLWLRPVVQRQSLRRRGLRVRPELQRRSARIRPKQLSGHRIRVRGGAVWRPGRHPVRAVRPRLRPACSPRFRSTCRPGLWPTCSSRFWSARRPGLWPARPTPIDAHCRAIIIVSLAVPFPQHLSWVLLFFIGIVFWPFSLDATSAYSTNSDTNDETICAFAPSQERCS